MKESRTTPPCHQCGGSGWLHGAQDWSDRKMKKGTPYKSVRCDCRNVAKATASPYDMNGLKEYPGE